MLKTIPEFVDTTTVYIAVAGLVVLVIAIVLRLVPGTRRAVPAWLAAGLVGLLIGAGAGLTAMHAVGYHWMEQSEQAGGGQMEPGGAGGGDLSTARGPMGPMAMGGGGGMGGGMMAGFGGSRASRDLTTLVWKLDVLTKGLSVKLDKEQGAKLAEKLSALEQDEQITGQQAQETLDAVQALLTDEQKAVLEAIGRPRRRRGSRSGSRGGAGAGPAGSGQRPTFRYPGMERAGTEMAAMPIPNPFREKENAQHLQELLKTLRGE